MKFEENGREKNIIWSQAALLSGRLAGSGSLLLANTWIVGSRDGRREREKVIGKIRTPDNAFGGWLPKFLNSSVFVRTLFIFPGFRRVIKVVTQMYPTLLRNPQPL